MFFIFHSNNREYFSKQKFNRYLNPYTYPYYLLILLGLQQLNILFLYIFFDKLLYTYLIHLQTEYLNLHANLTIKVINKIDLCNNIILYSFYLFFYNFFIIILL